MSGSTVWFILAEAIGHSGQFEASRILDDGFRSLGIPTRRVVFPALQRSGVGVRECVVYVARMLLAWLRCIPLLWRTRDPIHINVGQTATSLLRDSLPMFIARLSGSRVIGVALHGNTFSAWNRGSLIQGAFSFFLNSATCVSVLSERQRATLLEFGVRSQIVVVPNACDSPATSLEAVVKKQQGAKPLKVLHLSSLIDTKGYPEFLEGLLALGGACGCYVDATLCGRYIGSQYASRFADEGAATRWIEAMMAQINQTPNVRIRWVKGAFGDDKWRLFRGNHVFVFPSRYAVEAQPIVLLEAISQGLVCVSTDIGDIATIFPREGFVKLNGQRSMAQQIADSLVMLYFDEKVRSGLVAGNFERYLSSFTKAAYVRAWVELLFDGRNDEMSPIGAI